MRCPTTTTTSRDGAAVSRSWGAAALAVSVIPLATTGCGDDPVAPGDAPEGHTGCFTCHGRKW